MKTPKILINHNCLDMIIASAVEVCPKETNGLLIGRPINGDIRVRMAYPFQTDRRMPGSVEHGNISALKRLLSTLDTMNRQIMGGYHSHPYPDGHIRLTKSDVEHIEEEIERIRKLKSRDAEKWAELVLSVKRKRYEKLFNVGKHISNNGNHLRVVVRTGNYIGFDVKIAGYVLKENGSTIKKTKAVCLLN